MAATPTFFIGVFVGNSLQDAEIVTATGNPQIVRTVVDQMLDEIEQLATKNPILSAVDEGRRNALGLIRSKLPDGEVPK